MKSKPVTAAFFVIFEGALAYVYFFQPLLLEGSITKVFAWFSVETRYADFVNGILNVADVVYYITFVVLFVFLTVQAIKKRRWN